MSRLDWTAVRDGVAQRIEAGEFGTGDRLPTEFQLAGAFRVGRHSVRRAMAALAEDGLVSVERGRGTFVRALPPITYRVGRRTRWGEGIRAQGLEPGIEQISGETVPAEPRIAQALDLAPGAMVHRVLRRGLADGRPINLNLSHHCASRFPDLLERLAEGRGLSEAYRGLGVADYRRGHTSVYARRAEAWEASLLAQRLDAPVMVLEKVDVDLLGDPLGHGESVWSALRVRFRFEEDGDG